MCGTVTDVQNLSRSIFGDSDDEDVDFGIAKKDRESGTQTGQMYNRLKRTLYSFVQ